MLSKMEKRGQFYIMAALIIVTGLFSLTSVSIWHKTNKEKEITWVSENFMLELEQATQYALYSEQDIFDVIENVSRNFREYSKIPLIVFYRHENKTKIINLLDEDIYVLAGRKEVRVRRGQSLETRADELVVTMVKEKIRKRIKIKEERIKFIFKQKLGNERYIVEGPRQENGWRMSK